MFICSKQALNLVLTRCLDGENLPSKRVVFYFGCVEICTGARFEDWVAVGLSGSFGNLDSESNAADLESCFHFDKVGKLQHRIRNLI